MGLHQPGTEERGKQRGRPNRLEEEEGVEGIFAETEGIAEKLERRDSDRIARDEDRLQLKVEGR
jgi:hypothetical protein